MFQTPSTDKKIAQREENHTVLMKQGNTRDKTKNGIESCLKPQQKSVSKGNGDKFLKSDRGSQPHDPRNVLLQDIEKKKEVKSNNVELRSQEPIETTKLDPREALLQSIVKRQKPSVNGHKDLPKPLDPRQALLQSITQRRVENLSDNTPSNNDDLPSNRQIESSKPVDPRQALLQSINQRRRVEKSSNEPPSNNDDSPSVRSVMRSSRSLGCGIVPNWELAITTFDPS